MFAITVTEKGGEQRRLDFDKQEVTIGRVQGNDVILPKGNVSKRHARIVLKDGKFIIVDLKSTNGTYVNGRKITSPLVVKEADKIYIGDFILGVEEQGAGAAAPGPQSAPPGPPPGAPSSRSPAPTVSPPGQSGPMGMPSSGQMGGPGMGSGPNPMGPPPGAPMGSGPMPPMGPPPSMGPGPGSMGPGPGSMGPGPGPMGPGPGPMGPGPGPMGPGPGPMGPGPGAMGPGPGAMGQSGPPSAPPGPPPPRPEPSGPLSAPPQVTQPRPAENPPPALADAPPPPRARQSAPPPPAPSNGGGPPQPAPLPAPLKEVKSEPPRLVGVGAKPRPLVARKAVNVSLSDDVRQLLEAQQAVLDRLIPRLDLDDVPVHGLADDDLWERAESAIVDLVDTLMSSDVVSESIDKDQLIKESLNEALGLGPLEDLLADDDVVEILVDRPDRILVRRNGELAGSGKGFSSSEVLFNVIARLAGPAGAEVGPAHPLVNVRLRDGSVLTAAVPPVAATGCLHLLKPSAGGVSLSDLVAEQMLSFEMVSLLEAAIAGRRNILVCGPASAGKGRLVSALAAASPKGERIVSVSTTGALAIDRDEWIGLEAPLSGSNGEIVQGALRMQPDRLVVSDVVGPEGAIVVGALANFVDGALVAGGGSSALVGLEDLAAMVRVGAASASRAAAREMVVAAIDLVVCVARFADGVARVCEVAEVSGTSDNGFRVQELFTYRGGEGGFVAAGVVPQFYSELEARGLNPDSSIFR